MVLLDICVCVIVLLVGYNLPRAFKDFTRADRQILAKLFFYHILISTAFHFFISANGGDALFYWGYTQNASWEDIYAYVERGSASGSIFILNYIPAKVMGLSFFTGNLLYSVLGYLGFIYFYRIGKKLFNNYEFISEYKMLGVSIHPWVWFLPNLHFWSSGIGKDTILFFCIALFVYALQDIKKRGLGLAISLILSLAIRPHITMFLLVSFGIGFTLDKDLKTYKKAIVFMVFLAGFVSIFGYVMQFVQLESFELSVIEEYSSNKAASLNQEDSSSGVDTSQYPLPLKVFTFLYRPFFFDINGVLAIVASVENLILLIFTFVVIKKGIVKGFRKANYLLKGFLIYFILGSIAFSLILGNLGIMLRQKNMFFPLFFLFGMWVIYAHSKRKNTQT